MDFEWGNSHPEAKSLRTLRRQAKLRAAVHYCDQMRRLNQRYSVGAEDSGEALTEFDRDSVNICAGQQWAAQDSTCGVDTARLCRDYALFGAQIVLMRLAPLDGIAWFQRSAECCRSLNDVVGEIDSLGNVGTACFNISRYHDAAEHYNQAIVLARMVGASDREGSLIGNLGLVYSAMGRVSEAKNCHRQHLTIAIETHNRKEEAIAQGNLGLSLKTLGDMKQALICYDRHFSIALEMGDLALEATAIGNIANALRVLGDRENAIRCLERQLRILRQLKDRRAEAQALLNLGVAHAELSQRKNSLEFYQRSLSIAREFGDQRTEATILGDIGNLYNVAGDFQTAETYFDRQLDLARQLGDRRGEGAALTNLGLAHAARGEHQAAIHRYLEASEVLITAEHALGVAITRYNRAISEDALGNRKTATELSMAAHQTLSDMESPLASLTQRQLSNWREVMH